MISRRRFLASLGAGALAAPLAGEAEAQPSGKMYRVGFILTTSPLSEMAGPEPVHPLVTAFVLGLRALGYRAHPAESGHPYGRRHAYGRGSQECHLDDPHRRNWPRRSCSAGAHHQPRAPGWERHRVVLQRRRAVIRQTTGAAEGVRRVAILSNPGNPLHAFAIKDVKGASRSLSVQLQFLEAKGPAKFEGAFKAMAKERAEALVVVPDSMFQVHRTRLGDLAARGHLPAAYGLREYVEAGGLMSYGPSLPDIWRRAATYVDKMFKGAQPADLPVEQPTTFELVINLKTAKALGLTIPPSLLARADEVIE